MMQEVNIPSYDTSDKNQISAEKNTHTQTNIHIRTHIHRLSNMMQEVNIISYDTSDQAHTYTHTHAHRLSNMMQEASILSYDSSDKAWVCDLSPLSGVNCPPNYYVAAQESSVVNSCQRQNMPCPDNAQSCICQPCIQGERITFHLKPAGRYVHPVCVFVCICIVYLSALYSGRKDHVSFETRWQVFAHTHVCLCAWQVCAHTHVCLCAWQVCAHTHVCLCAYAWRISITFHLRPAGRYMHTVCVFECM
jgi:hypothetical protein